MVTSYSVHYCPCPITVMCSLMVCKNLCRGETQLAKDIAVALLLLTPEKFCTKATLSPWSFIKANDL